MFFHKSRILPILLAWLIPFLNTFAVEKEAIGWLEEITINSSKFQLKAKIDTGATTSSINAKILKEFIKNNQDWVRFSVTNKRGEEIILEREIKRIVQIKRKRASPIERPVIMLGICIGNVYREEEVNLANRDNFDYPVLVGRNYLQGYFLVDSEITYTTKPSCQFVKY